MSRRFAMEFVRNLFSSDGFMRHGYCYLWNPSWCGLHVISDVLIRLAYMSIPITLVHFVRFLDGGTASLRKPYTPDALLHRAPDVLDG